MKKVLGTLAVTMGVALATATAPADAAPIRERTLEVNNAQLGALTMQARSRIVTVNDPSQYVVPPGGPFDGTGRMIFDFGAAGLGGCTGSLLPTGRHILTAAHCVTDDSGNLAAIGGTARFQTEAGTFTYQVKNTIIHPDWDGDLFLGNDVAVVEINEKAHFSIKRNDIYRGSDDLGVITDKAGYGQSGTGNTGSEPFTFGTLRAGQNTYDIYGDSILPLLGVATVPLSQMWYDFDNGLAANDAFGYFFGPGLANLGLGATEVNSAPGDSGGPTFINGLVAGVTSYGIRLAFRSGATSDIDGVLNSSFGEFSVDTRVATYAGFVDFAQSIVTVPVPATLPLLGAGLLGMAWLRRRKAA